MRISQSAKTYADALIKMSQDGIMSNEDILSELNTISKIINSSDDLKKVLTTPTVSIGKKLEIIDDIFINQINLRILNFLKIIAEKNRFNELEEIIESYKQKLDEINNIKNVTIIAAVDVSDKYKQKIITKLQEKLNKKIRAQWQKDEAIIGGLLIRIDDNVIDTSIKNKLENLSKNIIKGSI